MPLNSFSTVIDRFTKISLLIVVLLFSASALKAQDAVYFKSRWTGDYIYCQAKQPTQNPTSNAFVNLSLSKTLWFIERVDDIWVRLRTKDSLYLHVENGKLDASNVPAAFLSSQWKLPVTDGHNLIINRWTGVYINFESHDLQASTGQPGWYSAQWSMEDKDGNPVGAKDFSLNAYTSFLPNQQLYYKLQSIKYDRESFFMDVDRTRSTELVTEQDYGGDNGGKAWKFTLVSDGWYKISNLKLGGNKVLAIAKNTDGSFYFVLTDFANYSNQLWRMIQFNDPVFLKIVNEKNLSPEKFSSPFYYTLVSKQHGLEALQINAEKNFPPRLWTYYFNAAIYITNPFDMYWRVSPVEDIAAIRNIPMSAAEQIALVQETIEKVNRITDEAILKGTPIAVSPFKPPVGNIKGEDPLLITYSGGRGDLAALITWKQEYTAEEYDLRNAIAGKIPMWLFNNTNFAIMFTIRYTDEVGHQVEKRYMPVSPGKMFAFYLDPMYTYVTFTGIEKGIEGREDYKSTKFYRPKNVKIYLDGTIGNVKETIWDW